MRDGFYFYPRVKGGEWAGVNDVSRSGKESAREAGRIGCSGETEPNVLLSLLLIMKSQSKS
jgi:hypothetical protein